MGENWGLFDSDWAQAYVRVRQAFTRDLLEALRQQTELASALDVGCGVGYFSKFLSDMGFRVVAVDGRNENVSEAQRRHPGIAFLTRSVEDPGLPEIGAFDFVLCVGLLYHLENPFRAIRNLHALTEKILLVESMCLPGSQLIMELLDEEQGARNQGLNYVAFYPSEPCLIKMLYGAGFPFVYRFERLPEQKQFTTTLWRKRSRTFLTASKIPLAAPNLVLAKEPTRLRGEMDSWATTRLMFPRLGRQVERIGRWLLKYKQRREIWIDVGAHLGEETFPYAAANRELLVYAFEPNLRLAAKQMGILTNFIVIPMAVCESDGCANFYINSFDLSSSLLPLCEEGVRSWIGGEQLRVESTTSVPTIRLDTFMNLMGLPRVDFLKVDAQGADLSVVRSAGERLKDIRKIFLEVSVTPVSPYAGACTKSETVEWLTGQGFALVAEKKQSFGQEENLTFIRRFT